jgi:hypothetical protein
MAALVHWLAGPTNDRARFEAALRATLPIRLAWIDEYRQPHNRRATSVPNEGAEASWRLEIRRSIGQEMSEAGSIHDSRNFKLTRTNADLPSICSQQRSLIGLMLQVDPTMRPAPFI